MNPEDPNTWHTIADHPTLKAGQFDPSWYDGDASSDLGMLRNAAIGFLSRYSESKCELCLLDDCTMFVSVESKNSFRCVVYPAKADDGTPEYFVDIEGNNEELHFLSVNAFIEYVNCLNFR
uniref:Uncharacterized protein n=1 Tax=Rubinisphaera brasiliensis (strain ATCC 49424 / DSM 5305 / JCM 21570 / IAM 15109 / NBRC 103401 / IFAM 1448) TaxID=756272 RepID=F0SPJ7_RUBBR|nr:hypothetical protein Plabr_0272 [Rubinisphaera brasiliensis DSM 5305]